MLLFENQNFFLIYTVTYPSYTAAYNAKQTVSISLINTGKNNLENIKLILLATLKITKRLF